MSRAIESGYGFNENFTELLTIYADTVGESPLLSMEAYKVLNGS